MSKKRNVQPGLASATYYAPVIVLPTTTPPENLPALKAAGYVVVLCDQPEKVIVKMPHGNLEGGDMLMAALHGIVNCGYSSAFEKFVRELHARMLKREGA